MFEPKKSQNGSWRTIATNGKKRYVFLLNKENVFMSKVIGATISVASYLNNGCKCGAYRPYMAYVPYSSVHDHVLRHALFARGDERAITFKFDVRDCFNSTTVQMLSLALMRHKQWARIAPPHENRGLQLPNGARYVSGIWKRFFQDGVRGLQYISARARKDGTITDVLAQGIPSSPALVNVALTLLDSAVLDAARRAVLGIGTFPWTSWDDSRKVPNLYSCKSCDPFTTLPMRVLYSRYADDVLITLKPDSTNRDKCIESMLKFLNHRVAWYDIKYAAAFPYGERIKCTGFTWTVGGDDLRPVRRIRRRLRALEHINSKYGAHDLTLRSMLAFANKPRGKSTFFAGKSLAKRYLIKHLRMHGIGND